MDRSNILLIKSFGTERSRANISEAIKRLWIVRLNAQYFRKVFVQRFVVASNCCEAIRQPFNSIKSTTLEFIFSSFFSFHQNSLVNFQNDFPFDGYHLRAWNRANFENNNSDYSRVLCLSRQDLAKFLKSSDSNP